MTIKAFSVSTILEVFFVGAVLTAQVAQNQEIPLKNWPAPLYWQPPQTGAEPAPHSVRPEIRAPQAAILTTSPLIFIAMTPCRVVDTRASQHFPDPFGQPSLSPGAARTFTIQTSTLCSIPSTAQAYSFNVTVVPPGALGYLKLYPHGQPEPNAVTLDDLLGTIVNNGAIVPAGSPNGALDAVVNGNTDLVIDINGYYAAPLGFTDSNGNTAVGDGALSDNPTGYHNTAVGQQALSYNGAGIENTGVGYGALVFNMSGRGNIGLGNNAGEQIFGNYNIDIGNPGANTDNGVIRIGDPAHHTVFVAAGVWNRQTNAGPVPVIVDQYGVMGTISSSRRYKEDIEDMSDASSGLLSLRPVKFRYRKPYPDGSKPIDYGLIAEEVAEVYPDLVVKNADGQIETVQYQKLTPMLLNEVQKDHETIQELRAEVSELKILLETLLARRPH